MANANDYRNHVKLIQGEAATYIQWGLPIIPLCSVTHRYTSLKHNERCACPGKIPLIANWSAWKDTTMEHLQGWINDFKEFNIGLPLGENSGYIGVDIDGEDGENMWISMQTGPTPETWEFSTGAGKRLLYQIPKTIKTKKFTNRDKDKKHVECSIMCTGQQTVLPPSVHHTGRVYQWSETNNPLSMDCADAPQWLIDYVKEPEPISQGGFVGGAGVPLDMGQIPLEDVQAYVESTPDRALQQYLDELQPTAFSTIAPPEAKLTEVKKVGKGKSASDTTINLPELLKMQITEGGRDNYMTRVVGMICASPTYREVMSKEDILQWALRINASQCIPPLDETAVAAKVEHFFEIGASSAAKNREVVEVEYNYKTMAEAIISMFDQRGVHLAKDLTTGSYFVCHKEHGPWVEYNASGGEAEILKTEVWDIMTSESLGGDTWSTKNKETELWHAIDRTLIKLKRARPYMFSLDANAKKLCGHLVCNGELVDWRTGEVLPWDVNFTSPINLTVDFDPDARCPKFLGYLKDWLPDEDVRKLIQEVAGYCLIPDVSMAKFFILLGGGRNGKSMFMEALRMIFSDEICANTSPSKLSSRFGAASLENKLVNLCDEIEGTGSKWENTGEFKSIVAGNPTEIERKGIQGYTITPVATHIFGANSMPRVMDSSEGWYRRQDVIEFKEQFTVDTKKTDQMRADFKEERSGILNWMIEGLASVRMRGSFYRPAAVQVSNKKIIQESNSALSFIGTCIVRKQKHEGVMYKGALMKRCGIAITDVFRLYEIWMSHQYNDHNTKFTAKTTTIRMQMEKEGYIADRGINIIKKTFNRCYLKADFEIKDPDFLQYLHNDFLLVDDKDKDIIDYIRKTNTLPTEAEEMEIFMKYNDTDTDDEETA